MHYLVSPTLTIGTVLTPYKRVLSSPALLTSRLIVSFRLLQTEAELTKVSLESAQAEAAKQKELVCIAKLSTVHLMHFESYHLSKTPGS